jgi:quinol-cytochrome oxidoreductase complex cytochrome b subunit
MSTDQATGWTGALRERAVRNFPPDELLPDRQPAYVASWIYVFGVLTLAAFLIVLGSGALLALKGPQWWHGSNIGHFVNSLHLWSVELFMAFMVIHLWGKFWMAAWRGKRAMTWITGCVCFLGSIGTAFTGYLIQTNFDSQWISTQAKDGLNSVGIGSLFNVTNFGQMLMWHIALLPVVVGIIIAVHILQVRRRGVVPPIDAVDDAVSSAATDAEPAAPTQRKGNRDIASRKWRGAYRSYDLVKEFVIAVVAVTVLTVALAAVFSSPDEKQITLAGWSAHAPNDFLMTAATELDGTSGTATYGAPYTHTPGAAQKLGPISLQHIAGVTIPVDSAQDFVVGPLEGVVGNPALTQALATWRGATHAQRAAWASAYDAALAKAPNNDPTKVAPGNYGPVPVMLGSLVALARSGGLDGALLDQKGFFQTDYTKPLLFLADGAYLANLADAQHLSGDQWGMMNETGSYPGQAWLWLYTFWYQIKPFSTSGNADALVWGLMIILSLGLILTPFIPGVRSIPRWIPLHRLIWRQYYRSTSADAAKP